MAKFTPFGDQLVIQPADEEQEGLIVRLDKAPYAEGTVVSAGDGTYLQNGEKVLPRSKVGERVIYMRAAAFDLDVAGKGLKLVRDASVLGKINR